MTPQQIEEVGGLLSGERVLSLGVLVEGAPYVGLLPYAVVPGEAAVLIHASNLAGHTRGLQPGAPCSILVHRPDSPHGDAMQIPRLTLQGTVDVLDRGSADYTAGQHLYMARFPASERTFGLGDFSLYRLRLQKGRYVGGFAQALNLGADDLKQLTARQASRS